jgi:integrase|tara:strand:- start:431 stop:1576 length:1146 start_codon:yes stop_codon:yes gene_type:complete
MINSVDTSAEMLQDFPNNYFWGICMEGKAFKRGKRWVIDFRRRQIGGYITTDDFGRPFWHKEYAMQHLHSIRKEVSSGTFNIDKYRKQNVKEWKFENRFAQYLEKACNRRGRPWSPSYRQKVKEHYAAYFEEYFIGVDMRAISDSLIQDFFHLKIPRHLSLKTKANIMGTLKAFYFSFRELDKTKIDWPSPEINKRIVKWIDEDEQIGIINKIPEVHRSIFFFMIWHGVRPGEARALKWDCVNLKEGKVLIKRNFSYHKLMETTKGRKERLIPIYSEFKPILLELAKEKRCFVFTNQRHTNYGQNFLNQLWRNAVAASGRLPIKLYDATRHSYASQLRKAGASMGDIQELLGHADIRTTGQYAHAEQSRLAKVIELKRRVK